MPDSIQTPMTSDAISDASAVPAGAVSSAAHPLASDPENKSTRITGEQVRPWSLDNNGPRSAPSLSPAAGSFGFSPLGATSDASSYPWASTFFTVPPPPVDAVGSGSDATTARVFQFPPSTGKMISEPRHEPSTQAQEKTAAPLLGAPEASCPVPATSSAFGRIAPVFGCSPGPTKSSGFGCFPPSNPLFAPPRLATACPFSTSSNNSGPTGFSCTTNGFNQSQFWSGPSFTPPWAKPRPLNVRRCYCGKVAGIRFSDKTDGTLGMFYCCPDYNEEAVRNGTQDRNYCTYKEWSNSFSVVRRCFCGKVAVLQKSERFDTRDRLFYSCPEYREMDVLTGRRNPGLCAYIEWCNPSASF